jgi:hypothetical protein
MKNGHKQIQSTDVPRKVSGPLMKKDASEASLGHFLNPNLRGWGRI